MIKFKEGDIVECIDSCGFGLINGSAYEISRVSETKGLLLSGFEHLGFIDRRLFNMLDSKYPNPPHPHRDLIIEWANGAVIQYWYVDGWVDVVSNDPLWVSIDKYRVKPTEEKPLTKTQRIEQLERRVRELESKP